MKKPMIWGAILLLCALLILGGLKALYLGWRFDTELSPDGRFAVHLDQVMDVRHPSTILALRDSDAANGYIRLIAQDGHKMEEVYSTGLTFVIVNWRGDYVEVQADRDYRWSLP
jgi:hypothetical protein